MSQAITALRQDLGDQLITRSQAGMTLTPGGTRLVGIASQIVMLGAEAHAAVRAAQGAPEQLRVVATSTFAEFVAGPLMEAFRRRFAGAVEVTTGVAASGEQAVLIANRLADVAFGAGVTGEHELPIVSEPIFKYRLVVVGPRETRRSRGRAGPPGSGAGWWTRPAPIRAARPPGCCAASGSPTATSGCFQSQTAAWAAAADGAGVAPAIEHLVSQQLRRGELSLVDMPGFPAEECWHVTLLERERRSTAVSALRRFLGTPEAMHLIRSPGAGRAAVPLQAPGLRHDLELRPLPICLSCSPSELVD